MSCASVSRVWKRQKPGEMVTVERPKRWLTVAEWEALPGELRERFEPTDEHGMWYRLSDHFEAFGVDLTWVDPLS